MFASSVNAVLGYVGNNADGVRPAVAAGSTNQEGAWLPGPDEYTPGREQYHADKTGAGSGVAWDAPVWPANVYGATKVRPPPPDIAAYLRGRPKVLAKACHCCALTYISLCWPPIQCWGEALARVFSTSHGLSCICVRLGGFPASLNTWAGEEPPSDEGKIVAASIVAPIYFVSII